jgi:hypothetical protein
MGGKNMAKTWTFTKHTEDEFKKIFEEVYKEYHTGNYPTQKYLLKFKNPVKIIHNKKKTERETEIALSFFLPVSGKYCYSCRLHPRHGYYITDEMYENMESITIFAESDVNDEKKVRQFVGRFHRNLWENIRNELSADYTKMQTKYYSNYSTTNISRKFPSFVIKELTKAIEEQKDYHYKQYGEKRDLSVETKMGEDGVFRAWFSSEYSGCGNGSYYLLINPTTAAFREDD